MNSYESSKWQIKLWRKRWYLYATFLYILNYIDVELWIDSLLGESMSDKKKLKLKQNWRDIKRHVELTKMCKYTSNYGKHDDDNFDI
jgi:hypothetical protein